MVDRYTTAPIELPADAGFARADLIFLGLDHSGASFEARLFLDAPDVDHAAGRDHPAYVGSFYLFGHGGCFGDVGHCDVPRTRAAFDLRPPHQLLPATRVVTVSDAIRARAGRQPTTTLTVVAHAAADNANDVLAFATVRLAVYAG